jgi:hypothetical protein
MKVLFGKSQGNTSYKAQRIIPDHDAINVKK